MAVSWGNCGRVPGYRGDRRSPIERWLEGRSEALLFVHRAEHRPRVVFGEREDRLLACGEAPWQAQLAYWPSTRRILGLCGVLRSKSMTVREKAEQVLRGLPEEQVPVALDALEAIERDGRVLKVLRERYPQKSEGELMESLAKIEQGDEAIERMRERFRGVPSEEIEREAVKAVREVRRERRRRGDRQWRPRSARSCGSSTTGSESPRGL